ncbi:MAG: 5-(carboxyamino)imidazole ribonucleotide mutase, partial [bacterium]|nr:5-(carboxyamino)imidazole ribonucleotide mutase [bacterium]
MPSKKQTSKSKISRPMPRVAIVMGSNSDFDVMKEAAVALKSFAIPYEIGVVSAHRTPHEMVNFAEQARERGISVIIAGAGGAAHLPGMIASISELPVIGVPVPTTHLLGQDSLLSIVQMPRGVPVATVAIGNAWNAGVLAAQILGAGGLHA